MPQVCDQGWDPPTRRGATQVQAPHTLIHIPRREHMQGEEHPGEALILTGTPVHILTV